MSGFRDGWVRAAAGLALLLPLYFAIAAFGTKFGLFDWKTGLVLLSLRLGPPLSLLTLLLGLVGLALAGLVRPRRGWRPALFALAVGAVALTVVGGAVMRARQAPPIHDVSTDLADPPRFSPTIEAERALIPGSNSLDLKAQRAPEQARYGAAAGKLSTELQLAAYPDIQPIAVGAPKARALSAARGAALALGWTIGRVDEQAGTIEGRSKGFWYGFVDDIVVRVTPAGPDAAVIDVRSSSRVGELDLGANAERVRAFTKEVAKELANG